MSVGSPRHSDVKKMSAWRVACKENGLASAGGLYNVKKMSRPDARRWHVKKMGEKCR